MAFREPFRTPLGAFQRSPLGARFRAGEEPPATEQHFFYLGERFPTGQNVNAPEAGNPDTRNWSLAASTTGELYRMLHPDVFTEFGRLQWVFNLPASSTQFEDAVYRTDPVLPYECWDIWLTPSAPSWSRATPAWNDPAVSTYELASSILSDHQGDPTYSIYELSVPREAVPSAIPDPPPDTVLNPPQSTWGDAVWFVPGAAVSITMLPIPNQSASVGQSTSVAVFPQCNVDANAPHYRIVSDGGFGAAGGVATLSLLRSGVTAYWSLSLNASGTTAPGSYVITIAGYNAWQSGESQQAFTMEIT